MITKIRNLLKLGARLLVLALVMLGLSRLGTVGRVVDGLLSIPIAAWVLLTLAPNAFEAALLRFLPKQAATSGNDGRPRVPVNHFDIMQQDGLYLRRFYLTPITWPVKLFIHKICLGDTDRDPHSHQWPFRSLILRGKYLEHVYHPNACDCGRLCARRYEQREAPTGTLLINAAEHTHTIEIVRPVWSLVFVGRKKMDWGFWIMSRVKGKPDRFVPWEEYLGLKKPEESIDIDVKEFQA